MGSRDQVDAEAAGTSTGTVHSSLAIDFLHDPHSRAIWLWTYKVLRPTLNQVYEPRSGLRQWNLNQVWVQNQHANYNVRTTVECAHPACFTSHQNETFAKATHLPAVFVQFSLIKTSAPFTPANDPKLQALPLANINMSEDNNEAKLENLPTCQILNEARVNWKETSWSVDRNCP